MTMYGCVPCSPTSKTVITCGAPESRAAESASRRNRACASSSRACRSESSLTATFLSRTESVARYTSPIPPRAISVADVYRFGSAWLAVVIPRSTRPDAKACPEPSSQEEPLAQRILFVQREDVLAGSVSAAFDLGHDGRRAGHVGFLDDPATELGA